MNMHTAGLSLLKIATAALFTAVSANASVVFSNLGDADLFDPVRGNTIGTGSDFTSPRTELAAAFSPVESKYELTRIELAINLAYGINEFDVAIATSKNGTPFTTLETFHLSNAMGPFGLINPLVSIDSLLKPLLSDGEEYWLIVSASGPTSAAWNHSIVTEPGAQLARVDDSSWFRVAPEQGAFRISGNVIPEPGTFALAALGVALLAGAGRVKSKLHDSGD